MNDMQKQTRIAWLDIMRGILMITIVIGHVFTDGMLRRWVFSFHVPAFFFLSGFCFHYTECFKSFLLKKTRTIVLPYFFFSIISILIVWCGSIIIPSLTDILECSPFKNILIMLYGNSKPEVMRYNLPLWFLPCLFITTLFGYGTETLALRLGQAAKLILIVIFVVLGTFVSVHENIALPWHIETACSMAVWFILGSIAKKARIAEKIKNPRLIPIWVLCVFAGGLLSAINTKTVGVRNDNYGVIPIYYGAAIMGTAGICGLAICINQCRVLQYIGKNSLIILGLHKFPILLFQEMVPVTQRLLMKPDSLKGLMIGIAVMIVSIGFSLIVGFFINKYAPWMVGQLSAKREK